MTFMHNNKYCDIKTTGKFQAKWQDDFLSHNYKTAQIQFWQWSLVRT